MAKSKNELTLAQEFIDKYCEQHVVCSESRARCERMVKLSFYLGQNFTSGMRGLIDFVLQIPAERFAKGFPRKPS